MPASPGRFWRRRRSSSRSTVLALHRSADALLVLVLGGAGYLYGGLIGAAIFRVLQEWLSGITPQYWQFWIGFILVAIVLFGPRAPDAGPAPLGAKARGDGSPEDAMSAAGLPPPRARNRGLEKRFGGLVATSDVSLSLQRGARQALIGRTARARRRSSTSSRRPLASAGSIRLDGKDITPPADRTGGVRRGAGAHLPDQPAFRRSDAASKR